MENFSLRSWWDFAREWFQCFGREAVNASGEPGSRDKIGEESGIAAREFAREEIWHLLLSPAHQSRRLRRLVLLLYNKWRDQCTFFDTAIVLKFKINTLLFKNKVS